MFAFKTKRPTLAKFLFWAVLIASGRHLLGQRGGGGSPRIVLKRGESPVTLKKKENLSILVNNENVTTLMAKSGLSFIGAHQFLSGQPVQNQADRLKIAKLFIENRNNLKPVSG